MTREEFLDRIDEIMCGTSNAERAYLEDLYDEVTKPHWISVEDDLPKEDVFVQVVCDGYVSIARRLGNRWQLGFGTKTADYLIYTPYNDKITHWMPMPAPPHHIIDANKKKVDRVIGTADHIKTALDVLNKEGGEE